MSWNNFENSMQNEGGFMDTTVNSTMGGEEKGNLKRGQNCVPVMITQLLRYGEKITIWGTPARIITFVGIIRNIESMSTKVTFECEDETGTIKCVKWLEAANNDSLTYEPPVKINSYARINGLMRSQHDELFVLIVNIQPMEDLNELLSHLMEVTLVSLHGEKMVNQVAENDFSYANTTAQGDSTAMTNGNSLAGLNAQQQMVLDIIQNSDPEYGAERDTIKSKVPGSMVSKVDEIIEFLSAEGHIYTTKTDDFFKAI